ncbi:hypothetical protein GGR20_003460 [Devosia subaequoris]|uniref:Uncharacterized protein n=1 Tax=Devosia subaequoris TaxID=395930 RepID=A0A7W6IQ89_9HYPH|nr:hypothetical protein [Devosia subaequoris]MBB4053793.1 hypothetical protein [Devosia subaequoris]
MSTDTRDSLALYIIAAAAILVTMFVDVDLGRLFQALLSRF